MKGRKVMRLKGTIEITIVLIAAIMFAATVYGAEISGAVKIWDIGNMELGRAQNYDGLEMVQAKEGNKQMEIAESGKKYGDKSFTRCIKTHGWTGEINYVPYDRAIKFTVNEPSLLTFYAYGGSATAENQMVRVSAKGKLIKDFALPQKELIECSVYLDAADTYYIYSKTASINVYYIKIVKITKGDINGDGKLSEEDMVLYYQYINGDAELSEWQYKAMQNSIEMIRSEIYRQDKYNPVFYSNKIWDFSSMRQLENIGGLFYYDGLKFLPPDGSYGDKIEYKICDKVNGGLNFKKGIDTGGGVSSSNCIPDKKALSVSTDKPCLMTIYVQSSSTTDKSPNIVVFRKGMVVKTESLKSMVNGRPREVEKIVAYLPVPDIYYIYGKESGIDIYRIELKKTSFETAGSSIKRRIASNRRFKFVLTGENIIKTNGKSTFYVCYNGDLLIPYSVGGYDKKQYADEYNAITGKRYEILTGNDIEIVSCGDGVLEFKINRDDKNWTGVLAVIEFDFKKAKEEDNYEVEIEFYVEE